MADEIKDLNKLVRATGEVAKTTKEKTQIPITESTTKGTE